MEIYSITCLHKYELDEQGWPEYGATRFVGYYPDLDSAQTAVEENWCDIAERVFDYAVIEKVEPGLYPCRKERWVYKHNWDTNRYELIEEPKGMKSFVGIL